MSRSVVGKGNFACDSVYLCCGSSPQHLFSTSSSVNYAIHASRPDKASSSSSGRLLFKTRFKASSA